MGWRGCDGNNVIRVMEWRVMEWEVCAKSAVMRWE